MSLALNFGLADTYANYITFINNYKHVYLPEKKIREEILEMYRKGGNMALILVKRN